VKFCYLAGTGRSGSHWIANFLNCVAGRDVLAVHEGFAQRTAGVGSGTLGKFLSLYLERVKSNHSAETFVECEGTLLDRVAMHYGMPSAKEVVNALPEMDVLTRGVFLVRHPFGYVSSVKASGWMGGWWNRPDASKLSGMVSDFEDWSLVEQAALSWQLRNAWFYGLVPSHALLLKYEDLLGKDVTEEAYLYWLGWMLDWFGIEPVAPRVEWREHKDWRVQSKNPKRVELTEEEKDAVYAICAPMMAAFGYER